MGPSRTESWETYPSWGARTWRAVSWVSITSICRWTTSSPGVRRRGSGPGGTHGGAVQCAGVGDHRSRACGARGDRGESDLVVGDGVGASQSRETTLGVVRWTSRGHVPRPAQRRDRPVHWLRDEPRRRPARRGRWPERPGAWRPAPGGRPAAHELRRIEAHDGVSLQDTSPSCTVREPTMALSLASSCTSATSA